MTSVSLGNLASLHMASLYRLDPRGRIAEIREPDPPPPPRFVLFRGPEGVIAAVSAAVPDRLAEELLALASTEPPAPKPPPKHLARYRALLGADLPIGREYGGPSFYLPGPFGPSDGTERIEAHNLGLLTRHFPEEERDFESRRPIHAVVEDGVAVSICFSSRIFGAGTPAGVFTAEPHRGRGNARRVVTAWAADVASQGSIPLYGTTWDNAASLAIATRLGAVPLGSDFWIR